jgi:hypothetical protein
MSTWLKTDSLPLLAGLLAVIAASLALTGCSEQSSPPAKQEQAKAAPTSEFTIDRRVGAIYTSAVWKTDETARAALLETMSAEPLPSGALNSALLSSRSGSGPAIVRIVRWPDVRSARTYLDSIPASARARLFRWVGISAKQNAPTVLREGSAVQWSEFLLRDPANADELSTMVTTMTQAMAEGGGAPDPPPVGPLRREEDRNPGLLGLWASMDGFEVFSRERTFGEQGYWEPYADNEHWMMQVVAVR